MAVGAVADAGDGPALPRPAGDRRRFLDRLVLALEPAHAHHAARYEAAMRARNKLLAEESPDACWLTALEEAMAEHGAAIAEARDRTVAALDERLAAAPEDEFARAAIALEGWDRRDLASALAANRRRDAAAGRARSKARTGRISPSRTAPSRCPRRNLRPASRRRCCSGLSLPTRELVAERRGEPPTPAAGRSGRASRPEAPRRFVRAPGGSRPGLDDRDGGDFVRWNWRLHHASTSSRERSNPA